MRKLVHIERVNSIEPIEGADKIELIKVLDWQLVAKKNEFKVGDLCCYHEIDSVVPEKPEYEFLRDKKFRIRTIKLRGQVSQGLALPMSILPEGNYKEGQDVTEILGVKHYDPEHLTNVVKKQYKPRSPLVKFLFKFAWFRAIFFLFKNNKKVKGWPGFVTHTDEENIQGIFKRVKAQYGDCTFVVTEKVDYQSATYFTRKKKGIFGGKEFGVCSRTQKKGKGDSLWWQQVRKYDLKKKLLSEKFEVTIQGESGDTKVQKNKYKISGPRLWIFNVVNNRTGHHFNYEEMETFCKKHGLETVPILDKEFELPDTVEELLEYSKGKSVINPKTTREGVVIRLIKDGKKLVSFKVKNPDFLIKHKE